MNAIKVDEAHRIQLSVLSPGDLYEPEIVSPDEIKLHRVSRSSIGSSRPAQVKVEERAGYSVGVSQEPVSAQTIKEALAEFP